MALTYRQHFRENLKLALPVMLTNIGHVMMGVTDSVIVGHVSATSLAAAGLASVVFNVFLLFGIGVSYAITPLVAAANGRNDVREIVGVVRHGLVVNMGNSLLLISIVLAARNLLHYLGQPVEVVALSLPYLGIVAFSLLPAMIFQTYKQFAEGLSWTKAALTVMVLANIVNVFLDYALVFGTFGFPALGLEGAGWATFFSRAFMAVAIIAYVRYHRHFRRFYPIFSLKDFSSGMFRRILKLGIPSGAQFIFEVTAFDFSLVMMGWLGTATQAAHQIAINLATLSYMTTAGIAAAATIRVGYFFGANDPVNMRRASWSLLGMALALMCCWATLFILARQLLPSLYVTDENVIAIASGLLVVAGLFQLADGAQVVCASALRGLQDVKVPSLYIFVAYWIVGLPLGYGLAFYWDLKGHGVWLGLLAGLVLTAAAMFLRLRVRIKAFEGQWHSGRKVEAA